MKIAADYRAKGKRRKDARAAHINRVRRSRYFATWRCDNGADKAFHQGT